MQERDGVTPQSDAENPYAPDSPAKPGDPFFGREALLAYIPERLRPADCRVVVLSGPRKIGKTSLLLHLVPALEADGFLPVYFDLKGRSRQPVSQFFADLLDTLFAAAGQPWSREHLPADVEDGERRVLEAVDRVGRNRKVVLLVDEFDLADSSTLPDNVARAVAFSSFRRLERTGRIAFVFALGGDRTPGWGTDVQGWIESAPSRPVGVLDGTAANDLLVEPFRPWGSYTDLARRKILALTGGHPYLLRLFAATLFRSVSPQQTPGQEPVGLLNVMAVLSQLLEEEQEGVQWMWRGLEPLEREIASVAVTVPESDVPFHVDSIKDGLPPRLAHLTRARVEEILEQLCHQQVLHRHAPGEYGFVADLFRRWIAQNAAEHLPGTSKRATDSWRAPTPEELAALDDLEDEFPEDTVEGLWWAAEHGAEDAQRDEGLDDAEHSKAFADEKGEEADALADSSGEDEPDGRRDTDPKNKRSRRARRPAREGVASQSKGTGLQADTTEFERLLQLGRNSFMRGQYEVAVASYRHALALQPGHVEATLGLVQAFTQGKQFTQALDVLKTLPETAEDLVKGSKAEVYLRWLDEVESDEKAWNRVMEEALQVLPDHSELLERKRGGRVLRIRRLLKNGRPLEAAAALGALDADTRERLADVQNSLLNTLEEMTKRGHSDAGALFSLMRRQLPSADLAWLRHLGPLLDEAERAERFNIERADHLFRAASNVVEAAGIDGADVPQMLMERLQAGLRRSESRRLVAIEEQLESLCKIGDLDRAEALLEEYLVDNSSEVLAAKLEELRLQRQLLSTYNEALACIDRHDYTEARKRLSAIVSEMPGFVGRDGRTALSVLQSLGRTDRASERHRRGAWYVVGAAAVVCLLIVYYWPFSGDRQSELEEEAPVAAIARSPANLSSPKPAIAEGTPGTVSTHGTPLSVSVETTPTPVPGPMPERRTSGKTSVEKASEREEASSTLASKAKRSSRSSGATSQPAAAIKKTKPSPKTSAPSGQKVENPLVAERPRPTLRQPVALPNSLLIHSDSAEKGQTAEAPGDAYEAALMGGASATAIFEEITPRVTRTDPAAAKVYVGQGVHYERAGRLGDALRSFQRAVELDPRSPEAHLGMGRIYLAQGNVKRAESELRTVVHLDLYGASGREARRLLHKVQAMQSKPGDETP